VALKKRILGIKGICPMKWQARWWRILRRGNQVFHAGHLSKENNFPELAYETVRNILKERNIDIERDIKLSVALRDKVGQVVKFETERQRRMRITIIAVGKIKENI